MRKLPLSSIFLLFIMAVLFILPSSGAALEFNTESTGQNFDLLKSIDNHVNPESESCGFTIVDVVNARSIKSGFFNFNEYMSNDTPSSWGAFQAKSNSSNHKDELSFGSYVLQQAANITWYSPDGTKYYSAHGGSASQASLVFEHRSYTGENTLASSSFVARADKTIEEGSIGEISFDLMCHLNITYNSYTKNWEPKAQFHVELDNPYDTAETIHLYFQIENRTFGSENKFHIIGYVRAIDDTTGATYNKEIFTGNGNDFNWMNVKIFFDCFNDVYNITVGQYNNLDMSDENFQLTSTSTLLYGQQHNSAFTEIVNIGRRYAPSHVVNAMDYRLESTAADGSRSFAYLDNLKYVMLKLPGVYADVIYANTSIKRDYGIGIRMMNKSLISTYEPPKYLGGPSPSTFLVFNTNYYDTISKPGLLTTFPQSPSWIYSIPIVASKNDTLNVLSILDIINDASHPIESFGRTPVDNDAEFSTNPETAFAAQYFELNSTMSETYKYYFNARYSSRVLVVEYYSDIKRAGILKRIQLFPDASSSGQIVYLENGWGNNPDIPGYSIEITLGLISVMAVAMIILSKKRLK